jgi:glyoxylase-like metal-dependent hydrolase (beta-lactamase superfamily II)
MPRAGRDRDERNCQTAPLASHACSNTALPTPARPDGASAGRASARADRWRRLATTWRESVRSAVVDVLDTYSGHTDPGGAAARRDLGALTITKVSVGPMDNNAYLLVCTTSGEALLVDAANEPDRLAEVVGSADGAQLRTTVTTHRHYDHWQALGAVADKFGTRQVAHPLDAPELPVAVDDTVEQGDTISVGQVSLEVIHLRGHTPGSIALVYRADDGPHIFTGDSLFPGGPGKTGSPDDFASLMNDLEERVFGTLPDETWVYPGHGDDTTLGRERPHLGEWRERGW